jgi:hypothetical protein
MPDRPEEPMRRLSVEIPDGLHHRLRRLALDERTTLAAIVRELLEREIARREGGNSPTRKASAA